jgi:hypothetical protein
MYIGRPGGIMIALELTNVKDFMNTLLKTETFDHFMLQEAVITKAASYVIDGHITGSFYTGEELSELGITDYPMLPFSLLRNNCFDLIKGKKAPAAFRFVFLLSPENLKSTLKSLSSSYTSEDITGIYLNIKYQNQLLTLTTGISYRIFSTDKSLEKEWDRLVLRFLSQHAITWEEL